MKKINKHNTVMRINNIIVIINKLPKNNAHIIQIINTNNLPNKRLILNEQIYISSAYKIIPEIKAYIEHNYGIK